jgi:hypothetical protein
VKMDLPPFDRELKWLSSLLRDLKFLEHLAIGGECRRALRWMRLGVARGTTSLRFRTLTIRWGEHERHQALRLKRFVDPAGLNIALICIPDPAAHDEGEAETDTDSSSED